jgi:hypothetical protein
MVLALVASGCEVVVRSSESADGSQADGPSGAPELTTDGRYVVFESSATNLVPGDTNGVSDVFVKDHWTDAVERVSVNLVGTQGNGPSTDPAITDDGRYVVFTTEATNLVAGDTNGATDVILYDREQGAPTLMSTDAAGVIGNGASSQPDISEDGRLVAFTSAATNLVAGDTNGFRDVLVRDLAIGTIKNEYGRFAPGNSADGDSYEPAIAGMGSDLGVLVFTSDADNLVPSICGTATPGVSDVYMTVLGPLGGLWGLFGVDQLDTPAGSADVGSRPTNIPSVAFVSGGDVYRANLAAGAWGSCTVDPPTLVSQGLGAADADGTSSAPDIEGTKVAFASAATNLVNGDTNDVADVFVWDGTTGQTTRASTNTPGQANGPSGAPSISRDGRYVAFASDATNFGTDTNGVTDVFARPAGGVRASAVEPTSGGVGQSLDVTITGTGFGPGATVDFGPGITVDTVTPVSATQLTATITVEATATPGPRTVYVELPPGGSATCTDCFVVTATTPALMVGDVTVTEGSGASTTTVDVTVSLLPAAAETVTVDWATADGTAVFLPLGERDYGRASGSLTFAPGETTKTVTLLIAGDDRVEGDETFTVGLSDPTPASTPIAKPTGTITILDDD